MPLVGTLVRLLLVGGGGCGKTRIFNMVLVPLLEAFSSPQGVMKEASSNKAARLLHGKTMHAASILHGGSSLRTVHRRLKEQRAKELESIYNKLGAKVIDQLSQVKTRRCLHHHSSQGPDLQVGSRALCSTPGNMGLSSGALCGWR